MANILFRGTVAPIQPGLVAGGSAAKNSPLTLEEGDWNYKALNDDIQTRAPIANPAFTGITTVQYNIRSAVAAYNQYTATINDSVTSTGCKIGEYLCNAISQNATIKVEVVVRNGITEATSTARVSIRSNILPSVDATIHQQRDATDTLGVTVEAWRDASTGKIVLFAVPTETVQNVSFKIDVFERTSTNLFVLTTTNVAKNTTGLTQITQTDAASFFPGVVNASSFSGSFTGALTGNASTATLSAKATILATSRTINGVSFDGSANITIADATKVPLNGSGATGTWNISVSGNAATATNATNATYSNAASAAWVSAAINASAAISDTSASMQVRNSSGTGDGSLAAISFQCQGAHATKIYLRADGYIGIGGWSRAAWGWYLDASNNMVAAGDVTSYSDPRLKENFARIQDPMAIIEKLDGGTFNWRHGFKHIESKAGKRDYGILADQVQEVMPEIVNTSIDIDGDSYLTVSYEKLVPVLIEAVRGLHARVKELEGV